MQLNVNTDAVKGYAKTLSSMHRSVFPNAVRGSLNKAAFEVKQRTLQKEVDKSFVKRQPNFFKAFSKVEMAKGFDIKQMKAVIGMTSQGLKGENNYAVKDLEQQEGGGSIDSKSFIPMDPARSGKSKNRAVRPENRLSSINNIVDSRKAKGKSPGQRFVKSVYHAGKSGHVLAEYKGKEILWRVNSVRRSKTGAFKLTPLYSYKKDRSVKVKKTGFMRRASMASARKIEEYFIQEARRQFNKLK